MYSIDLDDPRLRRRTWRWLRVRIAGLCSTECRLSALLRPPESSATSQDGPAAPVAYDDPS